MLGRRAREEVQQRRGKRQKRERSLTLNGGFGMTCGEKDGRNESQKTPRASTAHGAPDGRSTSTAEATAKAGEIPRPERRVRDDVRGKKMAEKRAGFSRKARPYERRRPQKSQRWPRVKTGPYGKRYGNGDDITQTATATPNADPSPWTAGSG